MQAKAETHFYRLYMLYVQVLIGRVGNKQLVINLAGKVYIGGSAHTLAGTVTLYVHHTLLVIPRVVQDSQGATALDRYLGWCRCGQDLKKGFLG